MFCLHKPITARLGLLVASVIAVNANAEATDAVLLSQNAHGGWQLEARQADLPQVLDAIASRSGTKLHYSSLPAGKVDATCVGDASALLHCLLGDTVNMAVQQSEKGANAEIWLMGSSLAGSTVAKTSCPDSAPTPAAPVIDPVQVTENWLKTAKAKDPAQRAQAMAELASGDSAYDPQIRDTLNRGVKDANPQVRVQALEALTKREGEIAAGEQLRQALNDSALEVRVMAVERIETDSNLLQLAARDSEPIVREMAQSKLEQLNQP